jgi:hypothetical protein
LNTLFSEEFFSFKQKCFEVTLGLGGKQGITQLTLQQQERKKKKISEKRKKNKLTKWKKIILGFD